MAEHDRLTVAPVLEKDLDPSFVVIVPDDMTFLLVRWFAVRASSSVS
jgi:hypothetical protein